MPKLTTLTCEQLKVILRSASLNTQGTKVELIARIVEHLGTDEIDDAAYNNHFPLSNASLLEQMNNMRQMMEMLTKTVADLSEQMKQPSPVATENTAENSNLPENDHAEIIEQDVENIEINDHVSVSGSGRQTHYAPLQNRYSVREIAETIPDYDPTKDTSLSVEQFTKHIEGAKNAYNWDDKSLLLAVYSKLKGVARMWFDSRGQLFTTWDDFKMEILEEFESSLDEAEVNMKMSKTTRRYDESITDYCFRIQAIGRRYNLSEAATIRYARDGLRNREVQNATAALKFISMKKFRETIAEYLANMPSSSRQTFEHTAAKSNGMVKRPDQQDARPTTANREFRCYNCGEEGHISKNCTKTQKKERCSHCGRTTHSTAQCTSRQPDMTERKPNVNTIADSDDTYKDVVKKIEVNGKHMNAFMDTGSSVSLIRETASASIGERINCHKVLSGFAGGEHTAKKKILATISIDGDNIKVKLLIVSDHDIPEDVLLGRDVLCGKGVRFVVEQSKCYVEKVGIISSDQNLSPEKQNALDALIARNKECFAANVAELGTCSTEKFTISLITQQPINMKPYRVAFPKRKIVADIIEELLEYGIVRKSKSNYASPVVLIEKKNGEHRLCIDYRALNKITVKNPFPMPVLEEQFGELAGNNYFTSLDLRMGYHQIVVHPDSIQYTAFITTEGHYEFLRMPFGLVNAPAVFQRIMNQVISEMPRGEAMAYLDDVIIPSKSIEEGMCRLENFLKILSKHGLTLRQDKCTFFQLKIEHLGHVISAEGVQPGPRKIRAIQQFEPPKSVTEVRRFLGLTGFFRKFVADYALISKPITKLLKNDQLYHWGQEQQAAFEVLIKKLTNAPVLVLYNVQQHHQVHTDACSVGLAGILLQSQDEKNWRPVMYFSRHCTEAEQKYHSHELEVLAIVETLERFKIYLQGKFFRVMTDCAAVALTKTQTELKPRIARWWMKILEFEFEIVHRPGNRLAHVDAMSRAPVDPPVEIEPAGIVNLLAETDWIAAMQHRDDRIKTIINVISNKIQSLEATQLKREYVVHNHRLYRKTGVEKKLVVPKLVRLSLVKHYHDDMGHFSTEKTLQRLQKWFWFPKMRKLVKDYIASCISCCYNKAQRTQQEGEMHFSDPVPIPFRVLHIDHLGPFIRSRKGNVYVLVVVDAFSKFCIVKAVRDTKTGPVTRALAEIFGYFGLPAKIISDRGTAFTANAFGKFCRDHNIRHIKTAVRTPRANGQVERANGTILNILRTAQDQRRWDENLEKLQWMLNSQPNKTTKHSPNELVFNYNVNDVVHNHLVAAMAENEEYPSTTDVDMKNEAVLNNIATERAKWKRRFDGKHATPTQYHKGDLVVIANEMPATGESRKLEPKFRGPYLVEESLGNDRYALTDIPGVQLKAKPFKSVYASHLMKPWCQGYPELLYEDDPEEEQVEEEAEEEEEPFETSGRRVSGTAELSAGATATLLNNEGRP